MRTGRLSESITKAAQGILKLQSGCKETEERGGDQEGKTQLSRPPPHLSQLRRVCPKLCQLVLRTSKMPLPSLSSLLSYLPTVSLSPLLPLPSNLQQRLVSFLLRKTLGGIVKGGLDSDRIHADIRDGSFAIGKVDIDQQVSLYSSSLGYDCARSI